MHCPICHSEQPADATTCRVCGNRVDTASQAATSSTLAPGTSLRAGAFVIEQVLGQGGFGITYRAHDVVLDRAVAIKEFFPQGCCSRVGTSVQPIPGAGASAFQASKVQFRDEAKTLARFSDPGIVHVHTVFDEHGASYMVMELLLGRTLIAEVEDKGPLPEDDAVAYATSIGQALMVVHHAGMLHRDIKPDNVIHTDDGRVVLVDFGTARAFAAGQTQKMTATLTPGYAPMEQYSQHGKFGPPTDVYGLAATLYFLLTAQAPVPALDRLQEVPLPWPSSLRPRISTQIEQTIFWGLELRADRRPVSIEVFLAALTGLPTVVAHAPIEPRPPAEQRPSPSARIRAIEAELHHLPEPTDQTALRVRMQSLKEMLDRSDRFVAPPQRQCPQCNQATLFEITGQRTDRCPICRSGQLLTRPASAGLSPAGGNRFCTQCQAQFLESQDASTMTLIQTGPTTDPWTQWRGRPIERRIWEIAASGKQSLNPGWRCTNCGLEFDKDGTAARLVRAREGPLMTYVGQAASLDDWHRRARGLPLRRDVHDLKLELQTLEAGIQQDQQRLSAAQQQRAALEAELARLRRG